MLIFEGVLEMEKEELLVKYKEILERRNSGGSRTLESYKLDREQIKIIIEIAKFDISSARQLLFSFLNTYPVASRTEKSDFISLMEYIFSYHTNFERGNKILLEVFSEKNFLDLVKLKQGKLVICDSQPHGVPGRIK